MKYLSLFLVLFSVVLNAEPNKDVETVRAWKSAFHTPTDSELETARTAIAAAFTAVDTALIGTPTEGDVRVALKLDAVKSELTQPASDAALVKSWLSVLRSDAQDMDEPRFIALRKSLRHYLGLLESRANTNAPVQYTQAIENLAVLASKQYPTAEEEDNARESLAWLNYHGQAVPLQEFFKQRSHPNLVGRLSSSLFTKLAGNDIHKEMPIEKEMQGTHIVGHGVADGKTQARLHADPNQGAVHIEMNAVAKSQVVGTKAVGKRHTATVGANGTTQIHASVPLIFNPDLSVKIGDIAVQTQSDSQPQWGHIDARLPFMQRLGGRLAVKMAWKQKGTADAQTDAELTEQLKSEIGKQTESMPQTINGLIYNGYKNKLLKSDTMPAVRFSTTNDHLVLNGLFGDFSQFGAPMPALSTPDPQADVFISVHESLMNNAGALLAGTSVEEDKFRDQVFSKIATQPEEDIATGVVPALLHFADSRPMRLTFFENAIEVRLRLKGFVIEGDEYAHPISLRTLYKLKVVDGGVEFSTEGRPVMILSEEGPGQGAKEIEALTPVAERFLVPRAAIKSAETSFDFNGKKKQLLMHVSGLKVHGGGWMDIGWKLVSFK